MRMLCAPCPVSAHAMLRLYWTTAVSYTHLSRRLVDFLSGVAYANNGQIKRVANSTFIITPYNVDIKMCIRDSL